MKKLSILFLLVMVTRCVFGAGATVSSLNGVATNLTQYGTATNLAVAQPSAGATNVIAIDSTGHEVGIPASSFGGSGGGSTTNIIDPSNITINTLFTNTSGSNLVVIAALSVTTASSGAEIVGLKIDQNNDGTFETFIPYASGVASQSSSNFLVGAVSPNGVYEITASGSGSASIISGSCQRIYSSAGSGGGGSGTTPAQVTNIVNQVNVANGVVTNGSTGFTANGSLILTNSSSTNILSPNGITINGNSVLTTASGVVTNLMSATNSIFVSVARGNDATVVIGNPMLPAKSIQYAFNWIQTNCPSLGFIITTPGDRYSLDVYSNANGVGPCGVNVYPSNTVVLLDPSATFYTTNQAGGNCLTLESCASYFEFGDGNTLWSNALDNGAITICLVGNLSRPQGFYTSRVNYFGPEDFWRPPTKNFGNNTGFGTALFHIDNDTFNGYWDFYMPTLSGSSQGEVFDCVFKSIANTNILPAASMGPARALGLAGLSPAFWTVRDCLILCSFPANINNIFTSVGLEEIGTSYSLQNVQILTTNGVSGIAWDINDGSQTFTNAGANIPSIYSTPNQVFYNPLGFSNMRWTGVATGNGAGITNVPITPVTWWSTTNITLSLSINSIPINVVTNGMGNNFYLTLPTGNASGFASITLSNANGSGYSLCGDLTNNFANVTFLGGSNASFFLTNGGSIAIQRTWPMKYQITIANPQ